MLKHSVSILLISAILIQKLLKLVLHNFYIFNHVIMIINSILRFPMNLYCIIVNEQLNDLKNLLNICFCLRNQPKYLFADG